MHWHQSTWVNSQINCLLVNLTKSASNDFESLVELTRNEQKKMNETKYGMARSLPHLFVPRLCEFGSQVFFDMHDNIICCQLSPVAHLVNQLTTSVSGRWRYSGAICVGCWRQTEKNIQTSSILKAPSHYVGGGLDKGQPRAFVETW